MSDQKAYYKNGCNPPLLIVKEHPKWSDMVWCVPVSVPWSSAWLVRKGALTDDLSDLNKRLTGQHGR